MKMLKNTLILSLVLGMATPAVNAGWFSMPSMPSVTLPSFGTVTGYAGTGLAKVGSFAHQGIVAGTKAQPEAALALAAVAGVGLYVGLPIAWHKISTWAKKNTQDIWGKVKFTLGTLALGGVLGAGCVYFGMNK